MNNIELIKLVHKIGIKEYNEKIIFLNAKQVYKELFENLYKENIKQLCKQYKELRNQKKLDNYKIY